MDLIQQILDDFRETLPRQSKTAAAIASNASVETISVCATEEGFPALAAALFEAQDEVLRQNPARETSATVGPAWEERLKEFRLGLPAGCETAKLIDSGAAIELISEAAEAEGYNSLASMLFEAEQEQGRND